MSLPFFRKSKGIVTLALNCLKMRVTLVGNKNYSYWFTSDPNTIRPMEEYKKHMLKLMGVSGGYKVIQTKRKQETSTIKSQSDLPERTMQDSYIESVIPLAENIEMQEKYVTLIGNVRLGRIMEDLDIFAVFVAQKHMLGDLFQVDETPYTVVTAGVDKINFTGTTAKPHQDIKIKGFVSWVGKTSMEVTVWLEQGTGNNINKITESYFVMAIRDAANTKGTFVNPLKVTTGEEKAVHAAAIKRKTERIKILEQHVLKQPPNQEEQQHLHNLYNSTIMKNEINLAKRILPPDGVWMENHKISTLILVQPEYRNMHYKVFGGFIMRNALELSFGLGFLFCKHRPRLVSISDIIFKDAIDVKSLIKMTAYVVYSQLGYIQITVYCQAIDARFGKITTSNVFHFTYEIPDVAPQLYPNTYYEAMMYVDGRRHFNEVIKDISG